MYNRSLLYLSQIVNKCSLKYTTKDMMLYHTTTSEVNTMIMTAILLPVFAFILAVIVGRLGTVMINLVRKDKDFNDSDDHHSSTSMTAKHS